MKNKGIKAERVIAKSVNGRVTPASGSGCIKGDVLANMNAGIFGKFNIQSKYTDKKSFTLKLNDLLQARSDAAHEGREVLFCISFGGLVFWVCSQYIMDGLLNRDGGGEVP